ncbi:MAG TPA: lysylphosphatidylglycerol synthase domain-containing protein [Vicinamibacterales bacterium]|nr:lysylphosphatidylglycerol synthase domain-containing protein [Vicinamibacterales bacterium]
MKRVLVAGATAIGAAAFLISMHVLGVLRILDAITQIGWGFAVILLLSGLREAARALAWVRTFEVPAALPVRDAFKARLAGEALNTLLPMGFVVGEPAKAQHVAHRLPFGTAFRALLIELAFYGASLVPLLVAGVVSILGPSALLPFALLMVAGFAAVAKFPRLLMPLAAFAIRQRNRVWQIAGLELLYHVLGIAEAYFTLMLISPGTPALRAAVVLETVNRGVTMLFKMVPMRMGVDEASAAAVAHLLALGPATGLILALIRKLRMLFWSAVGLSFALAPMRGGEQTARPCATPTCFFN